MPYVAMEPFAIVQRLRNRRCVLVCQHCGAFCGGDASPLVHCVAKRCPLHKAALAQALREHEVADDKAASCVYYCRQGCGETYCGAACEAGARAAGHASLCCGPVDEGHALVRFRVRAAESGLGDEYFLAAKVVALAAARPKGACAAWLAAVVAKRERAPGPLFEHREAGDQPEALWALLAAGSKQIAGACDGHVFTQLVLAIVERAVAVERPNPLADYCKHQGRKRVIQRRFNVGVLEEISERNASTL